MADCPNCARLEKAGNKVREGFENGFFVRGTSHDADSDWAMRVLPYLQALGALSLSTEPSAALAETPPICDCAAKEDDAAVHQENCPRQGVTEENPNG